MTRPLTPLKCLGAAAFLILMALAICNVVALKTSAAPGKTKPPVLSACTAFVRHFNPSPAAEDSGSCYCAPEGVGDDCTARIDGTWFALDCGESWCDPRIIEGSSP